MDNVKVFMAALKKYQFWAISGVVLITTIVCWWLATAGLASQTSKRSSEIDGDFKGVIIAHNHPNQGVIDKIGQQHESLKRSVFDAWEVLYREQKEKNPLPKVLGEDFKKQFENLKPKEELQAEYRELYQNFIMGHFPTLLKMIDVRRSPEEKENSDRAGGAKPAGLGAAGRRGTAGAAARPRTNPARMPGMPGMPGGQRTPGVGTGRSGDKADSDELIGTVDWNPSDYQALEERFDWRETPSTLAVVLAQEDLWVYEALLRIIKNTNEGATSYATASVKRIDALEIGSDAAKAWKDAEAAIFQVTQAGPVAAAGVAEGMGPAGGPPGGPGGSPGGPGGGMMRPGMEGGLGGPGGATALTGEDRSRQLLMESRYVDDNGKPLSYDPEFPYAKHPYAEFKMMPIRMNLVMDQRRLPKLLAECANSNMPILVRRIRILKSPGAAAISLAAAPTAQQGQGGGGATMPGAPGLGPGMPPGAPGMMMGAGRPTARRGAGVEGGVGRTGGVARQLGDKEGEATPFDIPVEVHGVIYIYNPPDRQKVGTGAASGEKSAEAAADSSKQAASPEKPSKP